MKTKNKKGFAHWIAERQKNKQPLRVFKKRAPESEPLTEGQRNRLAQRVDGMKAAPKPAATVERRLVRNVLAQAGSEANRIAFCEGLGLNYHKLNADQREVLSGGYSLNRAGWLELLMENA